MWERCVIRCQCGVEEKRLASKIRKGDWGNYTLKSQYETYISYECCHHQFSFQSLQETGGCVYVCIVLMLRPCQHTGTTAWSAGHLLLHLCPAFNMCEVHFRDSEYVNGSTFQERLQLYFLANANMKLLLEACQPDLPHRLKTGK